MQTLELPSPPPVSDADTASFQTVRPRLFGIAYRVLGSATDADDVVQDAWIRWQRADRSQVRDAPAFLATTTTRLAINAGQTAYRRHETAIAPEVAHTLDAGDATDPVARAERADAVRRALRTVQEHLGPVERAVFLLREALEYPFRQIAQVLDLTEVNARQIFRRARRRLEAQLGAGGDRDEVEPEPLELDPLSPVDVPAEGVSDEPLELDPLSPVQPLTPLAPLDPFAPPSPYEERLPLAA